MADRAPRPSLAALSVMSLRRQLASFTARTGLGRIAALPEELTFRQWCEGLAERGLKVDRKPFRLDDRPALIPIYDAIPTTRAEAFQKTLVIQKATQLGLTVWETLAVIYLAKKLGPVNIGAFLPDQATATFKSSFRFLPIVQSSAELRQELIYRTEDDGSSRKVGEGNVLTRQLGNSLAMFLWTSGKVSTESRPMDIVTLDEVQEMPLDQIDKVRARTGDSDVQFTLMLSTANLPELDINYWYGLGTQEVWHTECPSCAAESDLSDPAGIFPAKSVTYNRGQLEGAPLNEYAWTCPHCAGWIRNPQRGRYIPQNMGGDSRIRSFLLPRTISPRMTPRDMIEGWTRAKTGDQKKSFYNRTLARPYIDPEQIPVTMAHCMAAVAAGRALGLQWEKQAIPGQLYYMGIDQMGGFNALIIKRRLPDGRQAVAHVEATFAEEPFERAGELMDLFKVQVCVVEQLPNVNSARRFANKFPGRVYLAGYANLRDDFIVWGDDLSKSDRHTAAEDRTRRSVALQQYKTMQASLQRIRDLGCLFPDPTQLEQEVQDAGVSKRIPILSEWVFYHFTKTALVVEQDQETRKPSAKVVKLGIDPHFSFANLLCDVAWSRAHGTSTVMLPEGPSVPGADPQTAPGKAVKDAMPGLPAEVVAMVDSLPPGTCGRCSAYRDGLCEARGLTVGARDPGCAMFDARAS